MASYGHRSKPALYKPTDFNSQQKKAQMRGEDKDSKVPSNENSTGKSEGTQNESMKKVTILKPPQNKNKNSLTTPNQTQQETESIEQQASSEKPKPFKPAAEKLATEKPQSAKPLASNKSEEKPQGVSAKDFERIQKLREFMEQQQLNDKGASSSQSEKDRKEYLNKMDPKKNEKKDSKDLKSGSRNQRNNKSKGKQLSENQRSDNQRSDNQSKERKSQLSNKSNSSSGMRKQTQQPQTDNKGKEKAKEKPVTQQNASTKPKQPSKTEGPNDKSSQQRSGKDVTQHVKKVNSNYQQRNHNQNNQRPPQHNGTSILGNPYQHHHSQHPSVNLPPHIKQQQQQQHGHVYPGPGPTAMSKGHKPHITVPASKDKQEHKRSLDFVKNFFDNDPEVQYNRQKNAEKQSASSASAITPTSFPQTTVAPSASSGTSYMPNSNEFASYLSNHYQQTHSSRNPGANLLPQNIPLPMSLASNYSNFANFYPQSTMTANNQMAAHGHGSHVTTSTAYSQGGSTTLHQQQQQQQHRSSPGPFHTIGHGSMSQTPQSQQQRNFDIYSSINQNVLHHSQPNIPGSHFSMRSHATSHSSNHPSSNHNMNSYSNYFTSGSHHSHALHAQQEIDSSAISNILDDMKKPKKWQQKALSKCGPIDSIQARSLIKELIDGSYECMVCCDAIKFNNAVWSCSSCFHIFHLHCIRKWAKSEAAAVKGQNGWRCPGCQNISTRPPNKYFCFCGKVRDPDWTPRDGITPHSCGEVCKKKRLNPPCDHSCNELCHPGPCPSCPVMVTRRCYCGKSSTKVRCGSNNPITCDSQCSKVLECGQHHCDEKCHEGACKKCEVKLFQECFCAREKRVIICGTGEVVPEEEVEQENVIVPRQKTFSCKEHCGRVLSCGNHLCEDICHLGECKPCSLTPDNVLFCPCKKVEIEALLGEAKRTSCLDPVPTCDSFCGKKLPCGRQGATHLCMLKCHEGQCKPCNKTVEMKCRCNATKKEMACKDMSPDEVLLCDRKCTKKRKCGRHKCNQKCCIDKEHNCNIICGKKLSCGKHKCDEVCHAGFCPTCWRAGFDELSCHCGATVLYPPIPCGAKPPECDQPCSRHHPCGHAPLHPCHSEERCPPCAVFTNKTCMGGHQVWKNIPCHQEEVSCGQKCGKPLKCGMHTCNKFCHKGECLAEGESCQQKCVLPRPSCTHLCNTPCHVGFKCPASTCKSNITITCRCRRKTANALCMAGNLQSTYQSFNAEILNMQLQNLQSGQAIDISSLTNPEKRPKFLECDEECSRIERNKRFVEALGIQNPEGGHFECSIYPESLKHEARLRLGFIQNLETVFENLYLSLKKSNQQQMVNNFPPMPSSQRKIIHELAECYGFKTYSVDPEPKRSTVVIAYKESYVPQIKLSQLISREVKNLVPSSLSRINMPEQQENGEKMTLKSILKQPSQPQPSSIKRVNYFDDNLQE